MNSRRNGFGSWWLLPVVLGCVFLSYESYGYLFSSTTKNLRVGSIPWKRAHQINALTNQGIRLAEQGNFAEAEKRYLAAISVDSHMNGGAKLSLAQLYVDMNRPEDALKMFRTYFRSQPKQNGIDCNYVYAKLCRERGLKEEEQEAYLRILSQQRFVKDLAIERKANGDLDDTSMLVVHLMLGDYYRYSSKYGSVAREEYQAALAIKPSTTELFRTLVSRVPKSDALRLMRDIVAKNDDPSLTEQCKIILEQWAPHPNRGPSRPTGKVVSLPLTEADRKFFAEEAIKHQRHEEELRRQKYGQ
jgi:tetratricopeptide (TPR) repeat protein